jgi:hypothetical protein
MEAANAGMGCDRFSPVKLGAHLDSSRIRHGVGVFPPSDGDATTQLEGAHMFT